ncbi:MAG: PAS domain S-box protein [Bacteroidetes bacterium]|nr:PAS domain S-box protein [Bacteroidota bacterium]
MKKAQKTAKSERKSIPVMKSKKVPVKRKRIMKPAVPVQEQIKPEIEFRLLLESTQDIIWAVDSRGRITYISNKVKKILGYIPAEVLGKSIFEPVLSKDEENLTKAFMKTLGRRKVFRRVKNILVSKKGKPVYFETSGSPVYDSRGKFKGYQGFSHDVSDKVKSKNEFRKNEKIWRALIKTSPDGISIALPDGTLQYASDKALKMFGYKSNKEIIGRSMFEFVDITNREKAAKHVRDIFRGKYFGFSDYLLVKKNGTRFWGEINAEILKDENGKPVNLFFIERDITSRKKIEEELRENEDVLSKTIEFSPIGLALLTGDGHWLKVNRSLCKILGYRERELQSKTFMEISHPDDLPGDIKGMQDLKSGRTESYITEKRYFGKKGDLIYVQLNVTPVRHDDGSVKFFIAQIQDITEKKKSEERLVINNIAIKSSHSAIGLADLDGRINYVNDAFVKLWGYKGDKEILGSHVSKFASSRAKIDEIFNEVKKNGNYSGEGYAYKKDGTRIDVNLSVNFVRTGEGKPICIMASFTDITEKKLNERIILESEEKHRTLFEKMTQGVLYQDAKGKIISANPSASRILGISNDQMKGKGSFNNKRKTIREDGSEMPVDEQPAMISLRTGKQSQAVIGVFNPALENYIWIYVISVPRFLKGETKPYQVITTIEDISTEVTNRRLQDSLNSRMRDYTKQLEQEVKARTKEIESLFSFNSAIIDNAGIAIVSTDREGKIVTFNRAAENMLGYRAGEVIGKMSVLKLYDDKIIRASLAEFGMELSEMNNLSYDVYMKKILEKRPGNFEWYLKTKTGSDVPVLLSLKMLEDSNKGVIGYVGVGIDISRRIEAEKALKESEERFQKLFHEHDAIMLLVEPLSGDIVEANKSASRFYGYDFSVKGKYKISDLNLLSSVEITDEMNKATDQKYNYFTFPHKLASGEIRTVEVHSSPIEVNNRQLLFSVIHDITERRKTEEALRKSENENRAIVKAVPDMLFKIRRDGTYLETYSEDQSAFYVPPEQFLGKKLDKVLPPYHAGLAMDALKKAFETTDIVSYEYELPIKNVNRYFENRVIAISDKEALSIIRDITYRKKTEAALRESEKKYRNLHESMMDGYVMIEVDGTILEFNESYRKLTGYSEEELMRMNFRELTPPKWYEMEDKILNEQVLKRGYSDVYEKEYIRKDGSVCNVELHAFLIKDHTGGKDKSWAIVRDITERKRYEAALKMQSEAFESFVNPVVITDIDARIQWVNSAFTKVTGYTKEEAIGQNTSILKSGMHDDAYYKKLWNAILGGHFWTGEMINKKKDGTLYYEENTITPVKDLNGNIVNFIAVKIDITQKKEMENALKKSDERWQFALEGSGDGVWDWNSETDRVYISPQWKKMLGYESDELGSSLEMVSRLIHPDDIKIFLKKLESYSKSKIDVFTNEHRMLCKDGEYKWVLIRGKGVETDEKGRFIRIIGTQSDITQRKMFEDQLLMNLEKEKELNELKSRFISMASHEFRTPLASILLISDALMSYWKTFSPEQVNQKLGNIKDRVMHLTEIVNDVLHLSKIQGGKIEFSPEDVELVEECRKSVEGFNDDASLKKKIEFNCGFESLHILIDTRLMNQILNNLISNAIKYSPENPRIIVSLRDNGNEILLTVSDNGIGIPENDRKYIFGAFYRASNAKLIQGNGLGLNIIRESLISQGGDITFASAEGKGTTFEVHLPKKVFMNK